ncbi:MAG: hypothetical protein ACT4PL_09100 [Phycisphaerales bacterium]
MTTRLLTLALLTNAAAASATLGQFVTYQGNAAVEATWRAAAGGNVPLEDFEGFAAVPNPFSGPSDAVSTLPALGIGLFGSVPGTFPGVYADASFAHSGTKQLANFGGGINRFGDFNFAPTAGRSIRALGFWQCDPQGDQTLFVYDASDNLVGTITGLINNGSGNSFAGFISSVPIHRVFVEGSLGDGYNHIDDLQIVTVSTTPCRTDFNDDGLLSPDDLDEFITFFFSDVAEERGRCDFNGDGFVEPGDLDEFITSFFEGC